MIKGIRKTTLNKLSLLTNDSHNKCMQMSLIIINHVKLNKITLYNNYCTAIYERERIEKIGSSDIWLYITECCT